MALLLPCCGGASCTHGSADGFEERAMSLSVTGSNTNNPYINLQTLLQQQQQSG
jgi:hypothetical protein